MAYWIVYLEQPLGFELKGQQNKVYKFKKDLYGLKKDPRAWYNKIGSYLLNNGFSRISNEPTIYTKIDHQSKFLNVCVYVDDMIYTGNLHLEEFKSIIKK